MTWGDKDSYGDKTCEECGQTFILKSQTQPVSEREKLNCPECGALFMEYRAARSYWLEPKK